MPAASKGCPVRGGGGRVALIPWVMFGVTGVLTAIGAVSPFSTIGALMLANRPDSIGEQVYDKQILTYSVIVVLAGPLLVWAALVLPGW